MSDLSRILKESWAAVDADQERIASYFYARLFLSHPGLRDMFPIQMDVQRERLLGAIVDAVQHFDEQERITGLLRGLGRDHRKFHVQPEHYRHVGSALLEALRTVAGPRWSMEYEQAWSDVYDHVSGLMIAGAAADTNPPYWHAEVLSHQRRSPDVAVFTCRPLHPLRFRAGQYVSVETRHAPRLWRTYSMANAPRDDGALEFHVRAVGGGWVSSALVHRLRVGDMIRLAAPMGSMTLDPQSRRDVVCVAGGTGLAPVKALIDELARYNRTRWVHLFRGARRRDDLYDRDNLRRLRDRHPWLNVVWALSDDVDDEAERGDVADVVHRHGPWNDHDVFVSGSPPMVRATLRTLTQMRVPSTRIRYDAFADN